MIITEIGPFPPYRGGIAQFSLRLHRALSASPLGPRLLPVTYRRLYPGVLFPGTSQRERGEGTDIGALPLIDSLLPWQWASTRRRLRRQAPDWFIVQWWHPFFAPALLASIPRGARCAAVCHNVMPHESFPLGRALARRFLGRMDLAVVHGAPSAEELGRLGGGPEVLRLFHPLYDQYLREGLDRDAARRRLGLDRFGPDARVVLFFGLVRPYKGVEDLLEAFPGMPDDTVLVVAGETYGDRRPLEEAAAAPETGGRLVWRDGFVPDDEVPLLFEAADVVCLPYRDATQSGVAQIALAFGRPLVLTRTGGLPELLEEGVTGTLAEPGDPASLRSALVAALRLSRTEGITLRIRRFAGRFSWSVYAGRLLEAMSR